MYAVWLFLYHPAPSPTYSASCLVPFFAPSSSWRAGRTGSRRHGPHGMVRRTHGTSQPWVACTRENKLAPEELPQKNLGITSGRLKRLLSKNTMCKRVRGLSSGGFAQAYHHKKLSIYPPKYLCLHADYKFYMLVYQYYVCHKAFKIQKLNKNAIKMLWIKWCGIWN